MVTTHIVFGDDDTEHCRPPPDCDFESLRETVEEAARTGTAVRDQVEDGYSHGDLVLSGRTPDTQSSTPIERGEQSLRGELPSPALPGSGLGGHPSDRFLSLLWLPRRLADSLILGRDRRGDKGHRSSMRSAAPGYQDRRPWGGPMTDRMIRS